MILSIILFFNEKICNENKLSFSNPSVQCNSKLNPIKSSTKPSRNKLRCKVLFQNSRHTYSHLEANIEIATMQFVSNILILAIALGTYVSAVRIGSFNLHQYGAKKAANANLTNTIAQIISEFDLAIIQEISDVSLKAPYVLFEQLNRVSSSPYTMTLSPRVGRSATKEQFIFFNRASASGLEVVNAYIYKDPLDYFERPP